MANALRAQWVVDGHAHALVVTYPTLRPCFVILESVRMRVHGAMRRSKSGPHEGMDLLPVEQVPALTLRNDFLR